MIKLTSKPDSAQNSGITRDESLNEKPQARVMLIKFGVLDICWSNISTIRQYKHKIAIKYKFITINAEDLFVKHYSEDQ